MPRRMASMMRVIAQTCDALYTRANRWGRFQNRPATFGDRPNQHSHEVGFAGCGICITTNIPPRVTLGRRARPERPRFG